MWPSSHTCLPRWSRSAHGFSAAAARARLCECLSRGWTTRPWRTAPARSSRLRWRRGRRPRPRPHSRRRLRPNRPRCWQPEGRRRRRRPGRRRPAGRRRPVGETRAAPGGGSAEHAQDGDGGADDGGEGSRRSARAWRRRSGRRRVVRHSARPVRGRTAWSSRSGVVRRVVSSRGVSPTPRACARRAFTRARISRRRFPVILWTFVLLETPISRPLSMPRETDAPGSAMTAGGGGTTGRRCSGWCSSDGARLPPEGGTTPAARDRTEPMPGPLRLETLLDGRTVARLGRPSKACAGPSFPPFDGRRGLDLALRTSREIFRGRGLPLVSPSLGLRESDPVNQHALRRSSVFGFSRPSPARARA